MGGWVGGWVGLFYLSSGMPKASTRWVAEAEAQAAMCLAHTAGSFPIPSHNHWRMVRAFSIVSCWKRRVGGCVGGWVGGW